MKQNSEKILTKTDIIPIKTKYGEGKKQGLSFLKLKSNMKLIILWNN